MSSTTSRRTVWDLQRTDCGYIGKIAEALAASGLTTQYVRSFEGQTVPSRARMRVTRAFASAAPSTATSPGGAEDIVQLILETEFALLAELAGKREKH